jgi:LPS-assembly protein
MHSVKFSFKNLLYFQIICFFFVPIAIFAQTSNGQAIDLFREDTPNQQEFESRRKKEILKTAPSNKKENLKFSSNKISFTAAEGYAVQANEAKINVESKEGDFSGNVIISSPSVALSCSSGYLNIPYEVGVFRKSTLKLEDVEFNAEAKNIIKYSEFQYRLYDAQMTTCDDLVKPSPWKFSAESIDITEEGYAHSYWNSFNFYDVPLFYIPYIGFPVKMEKSSGLLIPEFGINNQDGFRLSQPFHIVFDDSTDATITPFIATNTRVGSTVELRRSFSEDHSLQTRLTYSDESARGDSLRGLVPTADGDVPFEQQRFGGFYQQNWRNDPYSLLPTSVIADIHYVSDDLMLREIPDNSVGLNNANFLTSRVIQQTTINQYFSTQFLAEYNQSIDTNISENDERMLQRLPEISGRFFKSFRPFGFNPYGLKLLTSANLDYTQFSRDLGVEGGRINLNPQIEMPFHYQNYLFGSVNFSYFNTNYNVTDSTPLAEGTQPTDFKTNRQTYVLSSSLSTIVEKVFQVEENSFTELITGLGSSNSDRRVARIKHQLEPFLNFDYVPDVDQDTVPLFDSLDRIRQRTLFTYGIKNFLIGRQEPYASYENRIQELTPRTDELTQLGYENSIVNLGLPRNVLNYRNSVIQRVGQNANLAGFSLFQSYDFFEASEDLDPIRDPFSDITADFFFIPNNSFDYRFTTTYNPEQQRLSSLSTQLTLSDDRGDNIAARYSIVSPLLLGDNNQVVEGEDISNIMAQIELAISTQVKLGYYALYDGTQNDFIDNIIAFRLANACNCWSVDLGFSDRTNPDRQQFTLRFNLNGLGQIQQGFLYRNPTANQSLSN